MIKVIEEKKAEAGEGFSLQKLKQCFCSFTVFYRGNISAYAPGPLLYFQAVLC